MKKILYSFLSILGIVLLCLGTSKPAMAQGSTPSVKFGYADPEAQRRGLGTGETSYLALAIKIPQTPGNVIKGISFDVIPNQKAYNPSVFIASQTDKQIVMIQHLDEFKGGRNEIRLEKPFTMEKGKQYLVGYQLQIADKALPMAFESTQGTNLPQTNFIEIAGNYATEGDPTDLSEYDNPEFGNAMIFVDIEDKTNALAHVACLVGGGFDGKELSPNQPASIKLKVRNLGHQAINSLSLSTQYSKMPKEDIVVQGVNIAPGATQEVEATTKAPRRGIGIVYASITQINGKPQPLSHYVKHYPYKVTTPDGSWARKSILIERFTTERCPNCPASEKPLQELIGQMKADGMDVSVIAHHVGYGEDSFTIAESTPVMHFAFTPGTTYAPALMLNRVSDDKDQRSLVGSYSVKEAKYQKAKNIKESLRFTEIASTAKEGKINLIVKGQTGYIDSEDLYLTAVITEDHVPSINQSNAPKSFIHDQVARKFLTPPLGQEIKLEADGSFALEIKDVAYAKNWKTEHLKIVVFAHQNMSAINHDKRQVYASKTIWWNSSTSNADVLAVEYTHPYAVDGYIVLDEQVESLEVYELSGRLVTRSNQEKLTSGTYVVRVKINGTYHSHKLLVH